MFTKAQERKHLTRRGASFNQAEIDITLSALRALPISRGMDARSGEQREARDRALKKFQRMRASF